MLVGPLIWPQGPGSTIERASAPHRKWRFNSKSVFLLHLLTFFCSEIASKWGVISLGSMLPFLLAFRLNALLLSFVIGKKLIPEKPHSEREREESKSNGQIAMTKIDGQN